VTVTDSSGNTYPFSVTRPSTSFDLSGSLPAGTYTATVYAVDSYGFAGAVSPSVSVTVSSGGDSVIVANPGSNAANPGSGPAQGIASAVVVQKDASQATVPKPNSPGATAATVAAPAASQHAGRRHDGRVRDAARARQRPASRHGHP
jgi:hypothetical protein